MTPIKNNSEKEIMVSTHSTSSGKRIQAESLYCSRKQNQLLKGCSEKSAAGTSEKSSIMLCKLANFTKKKNFSICSNCTSRFFYWNVLQWIYFGGILQSVFICVQNHDEMTIKWTTLSATPHWHLWTIWSLSTVSWDYQ